VSKLVSKHVLDSDAVVREAFQNHKKAYKTRFKGKLLDQKHLGLLNIISL